MKKNFFITGTDTGVGKTWITSHLLTELKQRGKSTLALKPIGCGITNEGWNEDAHLLMSNASLKIPLSEVNPYCFSLPIAPSIAAEKEGQALSVEMIWEKCQSTLKKSVDVLLVEGVGGWNVPLNTEETTVDLAKKFGFPVILVVGLRLGCLNHALLTCQAIYESSLPLAGWIANQIDPQMEMVEENLETLRHFIKSPFLGFVPFCQEKTVEVLMFSEILNKLIHTDQQ